MNRARIPILIAVLSVPSTAWPQGDPLGPEFRVNTYTTTGVTEFDSASVAVDPSGNFVVVWSAPPGLPPLGTAEIFGQRYLAGGVPVGSEFRVNTFTPNPQYGPAVASDPFGNFVVTWSDFASDGSGGGVFAQRFASSGAPLGPQFRVNTETTGFQNSGSVAVGGTGDFVVVWRSDAPSGPDIKGQRYASSGAPVGPEFRVNTTTAFAQRQPVAAADSAGDFVVVWSSQYQASPAGPSVYGQRFASSGAPLGPEFRVNTYTSDTSFQEDASVHMGSLGDFVVVWSSDEQDGSDDGVFAQRFVASGAALGAEFRVNTFTSGYQAHADVAADASGNLVVVWASSAQDGSEAGISGQRFSSSGAPLGPEFRVNTYTTGRQSRPSVGADPLGRFVVVWGSEQDTYNIFGQRYSPIFPVELMRFRVE